MGENNTAMMKAFVSVQRGVLKAVKDGKNPVFNSRYATLDSVIGAVREPLTDNGFALVQDATTDMAQMTVSVTTRLLHDSGSELSSPPLSAMLKKEFSRDGKELPPSVQQIGAAITYLRRYSLCPFLGVALDDDDDGNRVSEIGKDGTDRRPQIAPDAGLKHEQSAGAVNRRSAHTGEPLNTPDAVDRHKQAAAASQQQQGAQEAARDKPAAGASDQHPAGNAVLIEAINAARITADDLAGYLRGTFGSPRINKPMLSAGLGVESLGERIVSALLKPETWSVVVGRIKSDPDYLPF